MAGVWGWGDVRGGPDRWTCECAARANALAPLHPDLATPSPPAQALRTGVAMRSVEELCQTPEGTLGLVRGLDDAIKSNPALLLQLRSLLK